MKETIAVINEKGGVGKSTTAQALASGLIRKGYKVLLVDLDPQSNTTYTFGALESDLTSYEVLTLQTTAAQAIKTTPQGDIIPASPWLSGLNASLTGPGKEFRLSEALRPLSGAYDFVIIDTPPALGILTTNAMTAATGIIIPANAEGYSLQGIGQLSWTIQGIKEQANPGLKILGILLTRRNTRTIIGRDTSKMMIQTAKQIETRVFKTVIRECISVQEAQIKHRDLFEYAPRSNAVKDYKAFIDELLKRI